MAVQPYLVLPDGRHKTHSITVQWTLGSGDTGQPFDGIEFPDKTVEMVGTFGAAVIMEGCNELPTPTNYFPLTDPQGVAISMTALGGKAILENPYWVRPSAGAITSVVVSLNCAQSRR